MALALHDDQVQGMGSKSEIYSIQGAYNFLSESMYERLTQRKICHCALTATPSLSPLAVLPQVPRPKTPGSWWCLVVTNAGSHARRAQRAPGTRADSRRFGGTSLILKRSWGVQ